MINGKMNGADNELSSSQQGGETSLDWRGMEQERWVVKGG